MCDSGCVILYEVKLRICGIESERSRRTNIAYQLHVESKKQKKSNLEKQCRMEIARAYEGGGRNSRCWSKKIHTFNYEMNLL